MLIFLGKLEIQKLFFYIWHIFFKTMASNQDIVQFIIDQCNVAGNVSARKMFGDYTLYCNEKVVGLVCDNGLYLKQTESGKKLLRNVDLRSPYDGAKPHFYIEDIDDQTYLSQLVAATCADLPMPKPKKNKKQ